MTSQKELLTTKAVRVALADLAPDDHAVIRGHASVSWEGGVWWTKGFHLLGVFF